MSPHGILKRINNSETGYVISDPGNAGAIRPDRQLAVVNIVTAGAETRTLDDPTYEGQRFSLGFKTDGGDCVITADSAINQAGNTIMTFADVGDHLALEGCTNGTTLEWRVLANDGVALS